MVWDFAFWQNVDLRLGFRSWSGIGLPVLKIVEFIFEVHALTNSCA